MSMEISKKSCCNHIKITKQTLKQKVRLIIRESYDKCSIHQEDEFYI